VNDNAPRFPEDKIVHQLSEASEVGSAFVVPAAVDPDSRRNGVARYELRPTDGAFRLNVRHNALVDTDSDLRVVLVDRLDREANDRYQVNCCLNICSFENSLHGMCMCIFLVIAKSAK